MIERTRGEKLDLDGLPLDDAETYELLGKGLTAGIFQFESRGMTRHPAPREAESTGGPDSVERPLPSRTDAGRHDRRFHRA